MKEKLAWLKRYSETCGVSGFEGRMKDLMLERLEGMAEVSYDKLGSKNFSTKIDIFPAAVAMLKKLLTLLMVTLL